MSLSHLVTQNTLSRHFPAHHQRLAQCSHLVTYSALRTPFLPANTPDCSLAMPAHGRSRPRHCGNPGSSPPNVCSPRTCWLFCTLATGNSTACAHSAAMARSLHRNDGTSSFCDVSCRKRYNLTASDVRRRRRRKKTFILKSEEENAKNRQFQTAAITPLLNRR